MSFDRLAPHYVRLERLIAGPLLQRARTAFLPALRDCRDVLVAGVGPGRFLPELRARNLRAHITCVDASARMLEVAQQRVVNQRLDLARFRFVHARLPEVALERGRYDAIATHFFLDCFSPDALAAVVDRLAEAATARSAWVISDFAVPPHGWQRQRARIVHGLMYAFFRVATRLPARRLTAPDRALAAQGFRLRARREFNHGLLRADWWERV